MFFIQKLLPEIAYSENNFGILYFLTLGSLIYFVCLIIYFMLHNLKIIAIMILCIIEHKSDQISDPFNRLKIKIKTLNKSSIGFC